MLPESIPHYSVGPFFGLAANVTMALLCLVIFALRRQYRPLKNLFLFYLFLIFFFLGWVIYGLQKSQESILIGYKISQAGLAMLPASWVWFMLALLDEKPNRLSWTVIGISIFLAALALFGKGPWFFGLPLETHPSDIEVLRPQSKLLRPLINFFCLAVCLFYFIFTIRKWQHLKDQKPVYLLPFGIGLLLWFLGGLHDALLSFGVITVTENKILWFASLWLSVFLAIAIALHFRLLEKAVREELERLSKVKSKALDHLAHELRTPLSVLHGNIRILKRKTQAQTPPLVKEEFFDFLENNLNRLSGIQQETDKIIRSYQELEKEPKRTEFELRHSAFREPINLYSFTEHILENVRKRAGHRDIQFHVDGEKGLTLYIDPNILEDTLVGLLKNGIENTPDEGMIRILLEQKAQWIQLKFIDFGVGVTKENQRRLFDGLFHTLDTELYGSKRPYEFGAGGKGLDLLQMKVYSKRFGFDISVASQRCLYLPTDSDLCPGRISKCLHCKVREDCFNSGGSTFCLTFPLARA
jgi:signal transduction histidine kinase